MIGSIVIAAVAIVLAQARVYPEGERAPTLAETRAKMGIASTERLRGQVDAIGFASTAEQMRKTWDLSAEGPQPDRLGPSPPPGVIAALSPHDDYLYAGRASGALSLRRLSHGGLDRAQLTPSLNAKRARRCASARGEPS